MKKITPFLLVVITAIACNSKNATPTSPLPQDTVAITDTVKLTTNKLQDSFCIYTVKMLIPKEYLAEKSADTWYGQYDFSTGTILSFDKKTGTAQVRITTAGPKLKNSFPDITGKEWEVNYDQPKDTANNEMTADCSNKLPALLVPGRKIKFSMVEGCPGCGTSMNGYWSFTYIEALP